MKIAIIDYGVGNIANVYNAWRRIGVSAVVTRDAAVIRSADMIELPGVGAVRDALANLRRYELIPLLQEEVGKGKFFVGVCLGMQLLFEKEYEGGEAEGLGFLPGSVVPFRIALKVPHMGWNELSFCRPHWLQEKLPPRPYVYFVHSYYKTPVDSDDVIAVAAYEHDVPAVCGRDNILGMQFHPEKSGSVGEQILRNIAAYARKG